jgi:hypothetical protein
MNCCILIGYWQALYLRRFHHRVSSITCCTFLCGYELKSAIASSKMVVSLLKLREGENEGWALVCSCPSFTLNLTSSLTLGLQKMFPALKATHRSQAWICSLQIFICMSFARDRQRRLIHHQDGFRYGLERHWMCFSAEEHGRSIACPTWEAVLSSCSQGSGKQAEGIIWCLL